MSNLGPDEPYKWRNMPEIYKWCRQFEPRDWRAHKAWYDSLPNREDVRMYSIANETDYVGVCGLTDIDMINRSAEFSLYIAPDFQGKGCGKAALKTLCAHGFLALGLQHIFGETFDGNPAAAMFEKVGFTKEGTRRSFYYREGRFIDAHLYSILAKEFREKWNLT